MNLSQEAELQNGKYRIIRVLGQGGFGITYLAEHTMLDKMMAIKEFFPKEYCDRDDNSSQLTVGTKNSIEIVEMLKAKFIKEAKNISKLNHRNIITIHDIFQENHTAYYVMEYVEGKSLSQMIKDRGAIPEEEAIAYIRKVANAVGYMHSLSMNHLDLKPANIMVRSSDDEPILIDFGLSKQYDASGGQTSTTPIGISHGFAPIEQYRPGGVSTFTPQTDIYALGATLYNLLSGSVPPHYSEILEDGLPEFPISVSQKVADAVEHAMEVKKNKRPKSISEFLNDLIDMPSAAEEETKPSEEKSLERKVEKKENPIRKEIVTPKIMEETVMIASESNDRPVVKSPSYTVPQDKPVNLEKVPEKIVINDIEFVDMGLSVYWANKNLGAKKNYEIGTFIDRTHDEEVKDVLEYNLKGCMIPTIAQWEELRSNCYWEWTEVNGVGGYNVTGKNGNSIFLPFNGNDDISFRTFGRLFTRETFYKFNPKDGNSYYFYFAFGGKYKLTKYSLDYKCPVRLIYNP